MKPFGRIGLVFLLASSLSLSGCGSFFAEFVNFGFSRDGLRTVFELFGGAVVESDIEPLSEEPVIMLGNGISESASISIPEGPFILPVGNPFVIGELAGQTCLSRILGMEISELSSIILYDIDADEDDNDAEQILIEIITGQSPSLTEESVPGISGVELIDITPGSYTLAFTDGHATDTLTLTGPGIDTILRSMDRPADATEGTNALSLIDAATDMVLLGNSQAINPVYPTAGVQLDDTEEIHAFLEEVLREEPTGIKIIKAHEQLVSMFVINPVTGTRDVFVFFNFSPADL